MLQFPRWKQALVIGLCLLGALFVAPNLFYERADAAARARGEIARLERAGAPVSAALREEAARWPWFLPATVLNLGLDLRGGAHLLVEVGVEAVWAERVQALWPEVRDALRDRREAVGAFRQVEEARDRLVVQIAEPTPEAMAAARAAVEALSAPVAQGLMGVAGRTLDVTAADGRIVVTLSQAERAAALERTMAQSLEIVRRRIDEAGTREPTIQRQGERRILVQVPGVGSAEEVLALLGQTARLSFHEVVGQTGDPDAFAGAGNIVVPDAERPGEFFILNRIPTVSGENLVDASAGFDQNGLPAVNFRFDGVGARRFGDYTRQNVGRIFAIVLDGQVISAPRIVSPITGGSGQITGAFDVAGATRLAILLRAGALPAPLEVLEQRSVGPDLGADSIAAGRIAAIVAFALVVLFMVGSYGPFGLLATVALVANMILLLGFLSAIGATLTLPGIAGIVLTIGMAVDSNVLIFERIREEARGGKTPARAVEAGFREAQSSIVDANVTTLIAALILFAMGAGPIRGFAVTLGVGVVSTVFSAVLLTRYLVLLWLDRVRPRTLTV